MHWGLKETSQVQREMANASITKIDKQYWSSIQQKIQEWTEKTGAAVLALYIPRPDKINPEPRLKYEGSQMMKSVIESQEIRNALLQACTKSAIVVDPEKAIKEAMEHITIVPWSMQAKRFIISNLVRQFMELKYGIKRDIWGYRSIKPDWWPNDIPFISPNERRKVDQPLSNKSMDRVLDSYVKWKNSSDENPDHEDIGLLETDKVSAWEEDNADVDASTSALPSLQTSPPMPGVGGDLISGNMDEEKEQVHVSAWEEDNADVDASTSALPSPQTSPPMPGVGGDLISGNMDEEKEQVHVSAWEEDNADVDASTSALPSLQTSPPMPGVGGDLISGNMDEEKEQVHVSAWEEDNADVDASTSALPSPQTSPPIPGVGGDLISGNMDEEKEQVHVSAWEEDNADVDASTSALPSPQTSPPMPGVGGDLISDQTELPAMYSDGRQHARQIAGWNDAALSKYITKIWSEEKPSTFLPSITSGVMIDTQSLICMRDKISDEIIDAYLGILCSINRQFSSLSCSIASLMFHPRHQRSLHDVLLQKTKKIVAIVNRRGIHWILLIIDMQKRKVTIMDPMGESNSGCKNILGLWIGFLTSKGYDSAGWKFCTTAHPNQQDSVSCGLYCLKFAEAVVFSKDFNICTDNLLDMRVEVIKTIVNNPDAATMNVCRLCCRKHPKKTKSSKIEWIGCDMCDISWSHKLCVGLKRITKRTIYICDICKCAV